jgi:hypothetical protein
MNSSTTSRHSSATAEHYTPPEIVEPARSVLGTIDLDPASCEIAAKIIKPRLSFSKEDNGFLRSWGLGPPVPGVPGSGSATVFLNPPGGVCDFEGVTLVKREDQKGWFRPDGMKAVGQSSQRAWWFKLVKEWAVGNVSQAIFICFSVELLQSSQLGAEANGAMTELPIPLDFPICYPRRRVDYFKQMPDGSLARGGAPPHSSAIIYLPPRYAAVAPTAINRFRDAFKDLGRVVVPYSRSPVWEAP